MIMAIFNWILLVSIFCLTPAAVLWLCRKWDLLRKIGPVLILYILGVIIGNSSIMPDQLHEVQNLLSNAMVPLAIPLMLFGCTFRRNNTSSQIKALLTGIVAVSTSVVVGYLLFGKQLEDGAKIGGMLMGVYTGGTINLAALKTMLGVDEQKYILINSYDILVSFLYLTFLLTIGIRLFRRFLPVNSMTFTSKDQDLINAEQKKNEENPYKEIFTRKGLSDAGILLAVTLAICAVSAGIALIFPDDSFMTVFILMLTTLGISSSFISKIHEKKQAYDIGMYFIYIFCIVVASMADLSNLELTAGLQLMGYLLIAVFGSLFIQAILAKIFRIDADTMVIASVTFINSPPFVPMMAAAMKNRDVLVTGLSIGIIGYAIGNYLGYIIAQLLTLI